MDLSTINKGILFSTLDKDGVPKKYAVCSCGEVNPYMGRWTTTTCKKCGNTHFIEPSYTELKEKRVAMGGVFEVTSKDDSGFVIERSDAYAKIDVDNLKFNLVQQNNVFKADLSFKRGDILVYKNGEKIYTTEYHLDCVFRGLHELRLIDAISTEKNRAVYKIALDKYGKMDNERVKKMSRALKRLIEAPALQVLCAYGLSENTLREVALSARKSTETKPHLILGYSKYLMDLIRKYDITPAWRAREALLKLDKTFDGTTVKEYFKIFHEENTISSAINSVDNVIILWETHGYKDISKLITYVTRDVKLQQGITEPNNALILLRDYVKMMKALEHSYEKFPKSLKKVHDIAMMNYKVAESEVKDKAFKDVVEQNNYKELLHKDKTYAIIIPECVKDIIREGESLSHCVASYVDDIIKEKCRIVFLRYKETPEESLITIEVRGTSIRQVKGRSNRKPLVDEVEFVKEWAEKKGLDINCTDMH